MSHGIKSTGTHFELSEMEDLNFVIQFSVD